MTLTISEVLDGLFFFSAGRYVAIHVFTRDVAPYALDSKQTMFVREGHHVTYTATLKQGIVRAALAPDGDADLSSLPSPLSTQPLPATFGMLLGPEGSGRCFALERRLYRGYPAWMPYDGPFVSYLKRFLIPPRKLLSSPRARKVPTVTQGECPVCEAPSVGTKPCPGYCEGLAEGREETWRALLERDNARRHLRDGAYAAAAIGAAWLVASYVVDCEAWLVRARAAL